METSSLGWQHHIADTDSNPEFRIGKALWHHDLEQVSRFAGILTYNKSSLLDHVVRVDSLQLLLSSLLSNHAEMKIDGLKTKRFAEHHDDAEVITGDIPSPLKAAFTPEQRTAFERSEDAAMKVLAKRYMPEQFIPLYLDDWKEVSEKKSSESQIVDIADKWDGLCETITEIRCGNDSPEIFTVLENYQGIFDRLKKHPLMKTILDLNAYGFKEIPTVEEVKDMAKINIDAIDQPDGKKDFWESVFAPELPAVYAHWLMKASTRNAFDLGIFHDWRNSLRDHPLSSQEIDGLRWRLFTNPSQPEATQQTNPQE